jgi:hypothetical protein
LSLAVLARQYAAITTEIAAFRFSSLLFDQRLFPLNARRFTLSSTRLPRFDDL